MTTPLFESMRPTTLSSVLGQPSAVKRLSVLEKNSGFGGRAFLITGPSASGKTTLAKIIASSVADDYATDEMDASGLTPKAIQDWERRVSGRTFGTKGGWALIVNEIHGLRKDAIRQFLVTLERLPSYTVTVFTTTLQGQAVMFDDCIDAGPLTSRCIVIQLESSVDKRAVDAIVTLKRKATELGLDGKDVMAYLDLWKREAGNWRACWNFIESGGMLA